MARQRMIHPAIWDDDDVGALSLGAFKLFVALISNADDEGRLEASVRRLQGIAFRYNSSITLEEVGRFLGEILESLRSVVVYHRDGKQYIALLKWRDYQTISHPTASKLPPPLPEDSRNTPGGLREGSVRATGALPEDSAKTPGSLISIDKCSVVEGKGKSNDRLSSVDRRGESQDPNASVSLSSSPDDTGSAAEPPKTCYGVVLKGKPRPPEPQPEPSPGLREPTAEEIAEANARKALFRRQFEQIKAEEAAKAAEAANAGAA